MLRPAAALALLAVAGCSSAPEGARNVLLVTLDTTRADRIGAYGRPDARTPVLDRLARQGALLEWAIADVPVTLPSHTTIMTGIPALGHGVRYNADYKVADRAVTLAETLGENGWDTGAVVSALVLDSKFGIDQGFEWFEDDLTPGYVKFNEALYPEETHWLPKADRRADEAVDLALDWLDGRGRAPFFLWLHIYDPHYPFDPPPPWAGTATELYLAEIQWTDWQLGRLVRSLQESGKAENTVLIVTSDHGEGLDEHREDGHGIFLYDDTVRVPLMVVAPGQVEPATVIGDQVRTIDLAPTLLELAGLPPREHGIGGTLVPLLEGTGAAPDSVAYCESIKTRLFYGGSGLKGIRTRNAKYLWAPRPELYDLGGDPGETQDIAAARPILAAALRLRLEDLMGDILEQGLLAGEAYTPDAEMQEGLASLGYLSGAGGEAPGTLAAELSLAGHDPKDLVDVSMAAREIQNGFYDNGEYKLLRFFRETRTPAEDPRMSRLWAAAHQNYAKIWLVRGDYAAAAEQYRLSAAADSNYDLARWSRIYALNLSGQPELAVEEGAATLQRWPRSWRVRLHRALGLALAGHTEESLAELRAVAEGADPQGDAGRNARWYLERIGTPAEEAALASYLDSERRRT